VAFFLRSGTNALRIRRLHQRYLTHQEPAVAQAPRLFASFSFVDSKFASGHISG
jgi:hypothetical protein